MFSGVTRTVAKKIGEWSGAAVPAEGRLERPYGGVAVWWRTGDFEAGHAHTVAGAESAIRIFQFSLEIFICPQHRIFNSNHYSLNKEQHKGIIEEDIIRVRKIDTKEIFLHLNTKEYIVKMSTETVTITEAASIGSKRSLTFSLSEVSSQNSVATYFLLLRPSSYFFITLVGQI